jgi:hypothetical protein
MREVLEKDRSRNHHLFIYLLFIFVVLGIEPRVLCMPDKFTHLVVFSPLPFKSSLL